MPVTHTDLSVFTHHIDNFFKLGIPTRECKKELDNLYQSLFDCCTAMRRYPNNVSCVEKPTSPSEKILAQQSAALFNGTRTTYMQAIENAIEKIQTATYIDGTITPNRQLATAGRNDIKTIQDFWHQCDTWGLLTISTSLSEKAETRILDHKIKSLYDTLHHAAARKQDTNTFIIT